MAGPLHRLPRVRHLAAWLAFGLVVLGPLAALAIAAGFELAQGRPDWLALMLPVGRQLPLLLRSLALSALVALVGIGLGILIACAVWSWSRRWAWLRWAPLVLLALPPYVHALAWSDVAQRGATALGVAPPTGFGISAWVMAMALLPVGVGVAMLGLQTVAPLLVDAARTHGSDASVLRRVILPLAGPLLAAGGALIFLLSLMDYSVPSLFGLNVFALEIFAEFSASHEPVRALLLSVPLLVVAGAVLALGQALLRASAQLPAHNASPWSTPPRWPGGFVGAQRAALALWAVQALLPLGVLLRLTLQGEGWWAAVQPATPELIFSFGVAVAAALLSTVLAWLALGTVRRRTETRSSPAWLAFLPAAVPAPLVGIGLVTLWNQPGFDGLYATRWMPVLAALARFAPLALLMLEAQMQRVDPLLWDAARVFQRREARASWAVRLPLLWPGLAAAAGLVFALALGELGATLIVAPPGYATLTMRIYNYLHYGAGDVVAGLCLVVVLLTLVAGGLVALSLSLGQRRAASRGRG